jgi:two-component system, cell cycle sensor histidine kinase and response regulator CckA
LNRWKALQPIRVFPTNENPDLALMKSDISPIINRARLWFHNHGYRKRGFLAGSITPSDASVIDQQTANAKPDAVWKRAAAAAAIVTIIFGTALFFPTPAITRVQWVMVMGIVCLAILLIGSRLENRALGRRVAARTEIENRRQQTEKTESLGTMAGSIAHNFNNLLMVISGNLELAKTDLPDTSIAAANIQRAINAAHRAAELSSMMLAYVGQLKIRSVPVDLSQVVKAVLENIDASRMACVNLDLHLADPMPLVAADADQMHQMVSGFITNAIEALGKADGQVRISTGAKHCDKDYLSTTYLKEDLAEGLYAYVEVADTGCGMDVETLGKVFDPFFSTKFTGRGLGMAVAMGIIRSHCGAVKVDSQTDEGSVFTALFPIRKISIRKPLSNAPKREPSTAGKTVLLVDDEALVMEIGSQFLKRLGYKVLTASGGQRALELFRQASKPIDCLVVDFSMHGMDGLDIMHRIRQMRPDAKIIITSGYSWRQIEDRFERIGLPDDFIQKPFEMKDIQEKLRQVLA